MRRCEPKKITLIMDDETVIELPTRFEVCDQCEGRGVSSAYLGAFTQDEWAEQDEDFKADYIAGEYDRTCETCNGLRVVPVVDEDRCPKDLLDRYFKHEFEEAEYQHMCRMERLMGA